MRMALVISSFKKFNTRKVLFSKKFSVLGPEKQRRARWPTLKGYDLHLIRTGWPSCIRIDSRWRLRTAIFSGRSGRSGRFFEGSLLTHDGMQLLEKLQSLVQPVMVVTRLGSDPNRFEQCRQGRGLKALLASLKASQTGLRCRVKGGRPLINC